ncbi:MAG: hypothetical protein IT481_08490 [Gammaproteobacteria bacterium]|nr:hypothetical protein [Gammaproteobacteria bacterium]
MAKPRTKTSRKPARKPARQRASRGRPSSYQPDYATQAKKLCELGARDVDLADFFGVTINTIANWKTRYPDFLAALKLGKDQVDDRVERALVQRALGYTFDSVKIFLPKDSRRPVKVPIREHVPPDVTACIFWLKNRRRDQWRDVHKLEHTGRDGGPIETHETMSDIDLARRIAFALARGTQTPAAPAPAAEDPKE